MMHRIQLVDDDLGTLKALQRLLREKSWQVDCFHDVSSALIALDTNDYSVIIADYRMPKLDGIGYLEWARQKQPHATRLMISGYPESNTVLQAINRAEVFRFIKPWDNDAVIKNVSQAISYSDSKTPEIIAVAQPHTLLVEEAFAQLESIEPGITQIEFDEDGAITLGCLTFSNKVR
jgi:DNA-binding NtrC family response regulator